MWPSKLFSLLQDNEGETISIERNLLRCERAQQKATMVAISTRKATPAPTATPMMTAIGTDSGKNTRKRVKWRWALGTDRLRPA